MAEKPQWTGGPSLARPHFAAYAAAAVHAVTAHSPRRVLFVYGLGAHIFFIAVFICGALFFRSKPQGVQRAGNIAAFLNP